MSLQDLLCGLVGRVPGWKSGFDSRPYQIFWDVVGLERGPLNLVSIIEELLGRKSSGSGLENREYGHRDPSLTTWYPLSSKLAVTSPTSGGGSIGIVRSRTQATKCVLFELCLYSTLLGLGRRISSSHTG
jgi:hypothetical protein